MKVKIAGNKWRCFWGEFPKFEVPYHPEIKMNYSGKYRSVENAYIPSDVGYNLGIAIIKSALKENSGTIRKNNP